MAQTVSRTTVNTPDPWDADFAASLLTSHPRVPPVEAVALAYQSGLTGVARAMEQLAFAETVTCARLESPTPAQAWLRRLPS